MVKPDEEVDGREDKHDGREGLFFDEGIFVICKILDGMDLNSISFWNECSNPHMLEFMELNSIPLATKQHNEI